MRHLLFSVFFTFLLTGCALQADLVDMQKNLDLLSSQQQVIYKELKSGSSSKTEDDSSSDSRRLELLARLDALEAEQRNTNGKWEEDNQLISALAQRLDELSAAVNDLSGRLQTVETGLVSIEKSAVQGEGEKNPEPGAGFAPSIEMQPAGSQVVIPGRNLSGTTNITSIEAYNVAYRDFVRGNYAMSIKGFESFIRNFPSSSLVPQAQHWIGESYYEQKELQSAISAFEKLIALYPDSDKIPTAMLKESYALIEIGNTSKSKEYLKQILEKYPYSKEAKLAKEKLSELR